MTEMSLCNKAIKYKSTKIKEKIRGVFWDVIDQGWCQGKTVGGGLTAWVISQTVPSRPIVSYRCLNIVFIIHFDKIVP